MAAAAAETDEQYRQFVGRFLTGLSDALNLHQGTRAAGVKRSIDAVNESGIATSQKVVDARMALGADDALYLQSGLGLLWAGDPMHDAEHQLFPSSLGAPARGDPTRRALQSGLARNLKDEAAVLRNALAARLPALVYALSVPDIGAYVRRDLREAGLLTNAPRSLASLVQQLNAIAASDRHRALQSARPRHDARAHATAQQSRADRCDRIWLKSGGSRSSIACTCVHWLVKADVPAAGMQRAV